MNTNHNHRILIVDDSYSMRTLIKKILKDADFEVVGEAKDGEEAIQLAETLRPTIITMDINMPKMNGIEAAKQIKKLFPLMQIIGVTGVRSADTQQELLSAGAITIVRKPFQPAFLLGLPVFSELPLQQEEAEHQPPQMPIITSEDSSDDLLGTSDELFIVNEQIKRPNPNLLIKNDHISIEFEPEFESENKEEFSLERNKEKLKKIEIENEEEAEVKEEIVENVAEDSIDLIVVSKNEEIEKKEEKEIEDEIPILTPDEFAAQKAAMELEESVSKLHRVIRPPVQPRNYAASDLTKQSKLGMGEEEEIVLDNRGTDENVNEYKPSLWSSIKKIFSKN